MQDNNDFLDNCRELIDAYKKWKLWYMKMPEDEKPDIFNNIEEKLFYFTLPMALNYQRDSYKLWENVYKLYQKDSKYFSIDFYIDKDLEEVQSILISSKVALQPNKHISTWMKICKTIKTNFWSIEWLLEFCDYDFLKLKNVLQKEFKKWFPYISWPKIFNYWSYILIEYWWIKLKNRDYIEVAPDTHVKKWSVKLWLISWEDIEKITSDEISKIWRDALSWAQISPIDIHSPLWFWSRNNFSYKIKK